MTSSISDIASALSVIGRSAPGITASFYPPPPGINSAALPCAYVVTGDAEYVFDYNEACYVEIRTFQIRVAVFMSGQGDPHQVEKHISPLIQSVANAYMARPHLPGLADVRRIIVLNDSGPILLEEYGGKHFGFSLQIRVEIVKPREYKP
ncbi:MAG: hypothetical protein WCI88_01750 [Chloroflexota bacterium]